MEKLRLAMLGCGNIKHQHMAGIYGQAPDIEVTAAFDYNRHDVIYWGAELP